MSQSASAPDPVDTAGATQREARVPEPTDDPLRALTAAVASLTEQIAAKDQEIHKLVAQVVAQDDAAKVLRQQLSEAAAEHARQEQALRAQLAEVTASRDGLLASADGRAAEVETMIALRDQHLTAREWEVSSLRSEVKGLQQTVETLEARLSDIYASRTWVLSKKLWSARTKARKLIR